jgi:hypothetical protein
VAVLFRFARENVKQPMDMAGSIVANKNAPVMKITGVFFLENLLFYIKYCII